jgi:hypothetical protein
VAKTAFVGMVVVFMTGGALSLLMKKWMANPPLYGLYEVETFTLGDKTLPPLVTDASRWRWFIVGRYNQLTVEAMNGQRQVFFVRHDPQTRTLNVFDPRDSTPIGLLSYVQNKSDHLSMSGFIGSDPLAMQLRRVDESTFLLVNRGFKWSRESYD